MAELEVNVPPAELVDVDLLKVDGSNPNVLSPRRFEALKKSIQRYGFVVPIITNRDLLVADGEHRLKAAKALGMKQVSVVRLPVDDVDRRLLRQVMNKIRGEHDLFLDAEEYYRIVSEDSRDLIKELLNESDLRIDNLLKLREPLEYNDEELKAIAERFATKVESSRLDKEWESIHPEEPLTLRCHVEFSTKAEVTKRTIAVCEAFGLGVDEAKHFVVFDEFFLDFCRGNQKNKDSSERKIRAGRRRNMYNERVVFLLRGENKEANEANSCGIFEKNQTRPIFRGSSNSHRSRKISRQNQVLFEIELE